MKHLVIVFLVTMFALASLPSYAGGHHHSRGGRSVQITLVTPGGAVLSFGQKRNQGYRQPCSRPVPVYGQSYGSSNGASVARQQRINQLNLEYQSQLNRLNAEYRGELNRLNAEYQSQMRQLRQAQAGQYDYDQLNADHQSRVDQLNADHQYRVDQLNLNHQAQMDQLNLGW